jgi:HD-like signal output (HDOD) protein
VPQAVADVVQHLSMLPPFPAVTTKLLGMLYDDTVSMDDLASVVSSDPSLVAKVIHLANSPFYMVTKPVETVKDALFVLGINSIKSIATGLSVQKGFTKIQPRPDVFNMLDFWKHSYATAIVASRMGGQFDRKIGDTLYLTGLLHDIGKIILAYYWPDIWKAIVNVQSNTREPFHVVEARLFAHSHSYIAGELFRHWQFPPLITTMVENHHTEDPFTLTIAGVRVLRNANAVVNAAGYSFPLGNRDAALPQGAAQYQALTENLGTELEYQLGVLNS